MLGRAPVGQEGNGPGLSGSGVSAERTSWKTSVVNVGKMWFSPRVSVQEKHKSDLIWGWLHP